MSKGRKAAPTRLKVLQDTRADRMPAPAALSGRCPDGPPDYLDATAKAKWLELAEGKPMCRHRAELVTIYSEAFGRKRQATESLVGATVSEAPGNAVSVVCGTGGLKPHPALGVIRDCDAIMTRVLSELARLDAAAGPAEEADPLADLIARRKSS